MIHVAHPERVQLIRDGKHTVADLMSIGKTMLGRRHVQPAVVASLAELMVEGTFPTGTYLVTVHHPISTDDGNLEKALYGSFLPVPSKDMFPLPDADVYEEMKQPGAVVAVKGEAGTITLNTGRKRIRLKVKSTGDRPIQVWTLLALVIYRSLSHRSAPTTTSSRRTHSSSSIAYERMATASTSPLAPPCGLSPAIRRRLLW